MWFPAALLAIAVVAQAAAALLSGVTPHRHNVDDLANAVMHDTHPYKVVLLGDSVTHIVAHKYRIGDPDEVADLTTHGYAGLPSSLFLLKRYLESGHRPKQVIIAASRGIFVMPMDHGMFNYYVTTTFKQPYERAFMRQHYVSYLDLRWRPAALSITTEVGEPLFSLLRHPGNDIWSAPGAAAANPVLENFPDDGVDAAILKDRLQEPDAIRPEARAILDEFCTLSHRYQFSLHIIWAPIAPRLRAGLEASGKLRDIDQQLLAIFRENHTDVSIDDSNDGHVYPYFDRLLIHIKGNGWEQLYANELTSYVHRFDGGSGAPAAALPDAAAR
jgi:hypothetical protein